MELSVHRVALKPIASHLYFCIHAARTEDATFKRLQSNVRVLEKKGVEELGGATGVGVPDAAALEKIQQRWSNMHEAYSPNKKVQILLKVCKSIYHSMSTNAASGSPQGLSGFFFFLFYFFFFLFFFGSLSFLQNHTKRIFSLKLIQYLHSTITEITKLVSV